MISNRIIIVTANPKAKGGVSSVVKAIIASNIYADQTRFIHPHTEGGALLKMFVLLHALFLFSFKCLFNRPEFVHIHTSSYNSFKRKYSFIKICQLLKIKYLVHIHGGGFIPFYSNESKTWQRRICQTLYNAKIVISISPEFKAELEQNFDLSDCRVIPNFVIDLPVPEISIEQVAKKKKNISILFLGDISDSKGFEDAIKIISDVRKNHPDIILNCAGKQDESYFNHVMNEYKADSFVRYHGFVHGDEKNKLMMSALFILSPSKIETFGMSNLESALVGTPALAYNVGGVPSVIASGKSGYLAELGDWRTLAEQLRRYIDSDEAYLSLQQTCVIDMKNKFSINTISEKYKALYK